MAKPVVKKAAAKPRPGAVAKPAVKKAAAKKAGQPAAVAAEVVRPSTAATPGIKSALNPTGVAIPDWIAPEIAGLVRSMVASAVLLSQARRPDRGASSSIDAPESPDALCGDFDAVNRGRICDSDVRRWRLRAEINPRSDRHASLFKQRVGKCLAVAGDGAAIGIEIERPLRLCFQSEAQLFQFWNQGNPADAGILRDESRGW